jgi:hypothetical protein
LKFYIKSNLIFWILPKSIAATYFGCRTSTFIFCLGVRSPWRMTATTHRNSILYN